MKISYFLLFAGAAAAARNYIFHFIVADVYSFNSIIPAILDRV